MGTPASSLLTQALHPGSSGGFCDGRIRAAGGARRGLGVERLSAAVIFTTPVMWFFLFSTGVTLMVLRDARAG